MEQNQNQSDHNDNHQQGIKHKTALIIFSFLMIFAASYIYIVKNQENTIIENSNLDQESQLYQIELQLQKSFGNLTQQINLNKDNVKYKTYQSQNADDLKIKDLNATNILNSQQKVKQFYEKLQKVNNQHQELTNLILNQRDQIQQFENCKSQLNLDKVSFTQINNEFKQVKDKQKQIESQFKQLHQDDINQNSQSQKQALLQEYRQLENEKHQLLIKDSQFTLQLKKSNITEDLQLKQQEKGKFQSELDKKQKKIDELKKEKDDINQKLTQLDIEYSNCIDEENTFKEQLKLENESHDTDSQENLYRYYIKKQVNLLNKIQQRYDIKEQLAKEPHLNENDEQRNKLQQDIENIKQQQITESNKRINYEQLLWKLLNKQEDQFGYQQNLELKSFECKSLKDSLDSLIKQKNQRNLDSLLKHEQEQLQVLLTKQQNHLNDIDQLYKQSQDSQQLLQSHDELMKQIIDKLNKVQQQLKDLEQLKKPENEQLNKQREQLIQDSQENKEIYLRFKVEIDSKYDNLRNLLNQCQELKKGNLSQYKSIKSKFDLFQEDLKNIYQLKVHLDPIISQILPQDTEDCKEVSNSQQYLYFCKDRETFKQKISQL